MNITKENDYHYMDYSGICSGNKYQFFRFDKLEWVSPVISWDLVFCNMNGDITYTIEKEVTKSSSITAESS